MPEKRQKWKRLGGIALLVATPGAIWVLVTVLRAIRQGDPHALQLPFLPPCLLHSLTGLYCAGCGITRAVHYALNGQFYAAFRMNALLVVLLPVLFGCLLVELWRRLRRRRSLNLPGWLLWGMLGLVVAFMVLRNLPFAPFCYLAPTYLP